MKRLVGTFFGAGLLRPAPGTWGSLAALPFALALHWIGGWILMVLVAAALVPIGVWALGGMTEHDHDPSECVIDEVAGMLVACLPVSYGIAFSGAAALDLWPGWLTAFLAFRLFDIWKPGPVGYFDRQETAMGVMLDDIAAGVLAALAVIALAVLWHVVFLDVLS